MNIDERILKRFEDLNQIVEDGKILSGENNLINIREFTAWGLSALSLFQRIFGTTSLQFKEFEEAFNNVREDGYSGDADICLGVFQSAYDDFKNGYLFNLRTLVNAELGDSILEQAKALLNGGYKDIACVTAGIAMELGLKDLCRRKAVKFDSQTKLEKLNTELRSVNVYNESMRKQITAWIARRNHAAHGEWDQYNHLDVNDLINGVERFLGDYLS